jgi:hypothetical protein
MASASCGVGVPAHQLADLDGDGLVDLVVTETCDDDVTVGDTRWLLYRNTGLSFATEPVDFGLPGAYGAEGTTPFSAASEMVACGDDTPGHAIDDIDGDGFVDLVVTDVCDDAASGSSHWYVHFGDGSAFAEEAYAFPLPTIYSTAGARVFAAPSTVLDCDATKIPWALFDWDGDGDPDLLITGACIGSGSEDVGDSYWLVHTADCVP